MSTPFQIVGRQTLVAPLGLRFRDASTGSAVSRGLRVTLYPTANPARRTRAYANGSGVYVAHRAAGLRESEVGAGDAEFRDAPPASAHFTVEVVDDERRYLPYSFPLTLPAKGISTALLFSAPTRSAGGGLATLRASLWDPIAAAPAAWALLEARFTGQPVVRGLADELGRVALVFPYPEPATFAEQSPPSAPFTKQEWPVQLFASYLSQRPVPTLPSLPDALAQPRAKLWADSALTTPFTQATLRSGQELVVRSFDTSPEAPTGGTPLSVLLITPAGSPP
jgi:hypothetical protein